MSGTVRIIRFTEEGRRAFCEKWEKELAEKESKTSYTEATYSAIRPGQDGDYTTKITRTVYVGRFKDRVKAKKTISVRVPAEWVSDRYESNEGPAFLRDLICGK